MKTATIRDLRHNLSKVEAWVRQGGDVLITKRGKPVMRISLPDMAERKRPPADFRKIRSEVSEGRFLPKEDVQRMWEMLRGERGI